MEVPSVVSLLDGLDGDGVRVSYLCRQGVCGECGLPVRRAEALEHRDFVLTAEEKQAARHVMACVSRGRDIHLDI